jgi:hypothetical protein
MPRRPTQDDTPGHDAFLDVVANMVGILIILVLVVGVRVKNAPVTLAIPQAADETPPEVAELERQAATEASLRDDVLATREQIRRLAQQAEAHAQARNALATMVATAEAEINRRRETLDEEARREFDLKRRLAESQRHLAAIEQQRSQIEAAPGAPEVIENRPTPISRTVDDNEAHFQLRAGRIAWVPLQRLVEELKAQFQHRTSRLQFDPEFTETIGPVDGFRLRYTLVRKEIAPEMAMDLGHGGYVVSLAQFDLLPLSSGLGEPVDAALAAGSELRRRLAGMRPGRTTVTVWVYPESFAAFRRVRDELYRLGFTVAARPLVEGDLIGGSPEGTKSAAQ